jgi:hypothetical protein
MRSYFLAQLAQKAEWGIITLCSPSVIYNLSHSHSIFFLETAKPNALTILFSWVLKPFALYACSTGLYTRYYVTVNQVMMATTSSWISDKLRDIYSIWRHCWNVATYKWNDHNGKIEIISFVVLNRPFKLYKKFWNIC